jgi:hypothetical protein
LLDSARDLKIASGSPLALRMLRKVVCVGMIIVFPAFTVAQSNEAAMVYGKGMVQVNGSPMPAFTLAVFAGDSIETKTGSTANVNAPGASVSLEPDTLIKYGTDAILFERGMVSVVASKALTVNAEGISSVPASSNETEFEVFTARAEMHVIARRSDLNVVCRSESFHLLADEEVIRDERGHCRKAAKYNGAYVPDSAPISSNPWTWGTAGVIGGILCAVFCLGGSNPSMSPSTMTGK